MDSQSVEIRRRRISLYLGPSIKHMQDTILSYNCIQIYISKLPEHLVQYQYILRNFYARTDTQNNMFYAKTHAKNRARSRKSGKGLGWPNGFPHSPISKILTTLKQGNMEI